MNYYKTKPGFPIALNLKFGDDNLPHVTGLRFIHDHWFDTCPSILLRLNSVEGFLVSHCFMNHPKIIPFKGILYNTKKIKDLSEVVTPPYDVIHPQMQEELYERSPYNFVRIDLAKDPGEERYLAAQKAFEQWIKEGVLVQDQAASIYLHHQTFTLPDGNQVTRKGFFAARRIEDFSEGGVKPHEKTLEGPKADRLKLTKALKVNLSPVFSLYSDPEKRIDDQVKKIKSQKPDFDFKTKEGERHEMWRLTDPSICGMINEFLMDRPVFIADGHHRYETALNYRNECRRANPPGNGQEGFNYLLMYLSNLNDEGLVILPIHRALHNIKGLDLNQLLEKLGSYFDVTPIRGEDQQEMLSALEKEGGAHHAFILVTKNPGQTYLVNMNRSQWKKSDVAKTVPHALIELDVTVLHRLVFEEILGISQEAQAQQTNIIYWKDTTRAINETRGGACDFTFLLNPTRIEDMEKVAMAGEKMPQKSTFFYPKILSGLVINPLTIP